MCKEEEDSVLRVLYSQVAFDDIGLTWGKSDGTVYRGGQRRLHSRGGDRREGGGSLTRLPRMVLFEVRVDCDSTSTIRYHNASQDTIHTSASSSVSSENNDSEEGLEAEMARLGLPCAFGKQQPEGGGMSTNKKAKKKKKIYDITTDDAVKDVWVQAFDESTGFYYYYNTALGVSQWSVPKDGVYDAMPGGHLLQEIGPLVDEKNIDEREDDMMPMAEVFDPPPCPVLNKDREKNSLYSSKNKRFVPRPETSGIHDDGIPDAPTASTHIRFASDDDANKIQQTGGSQGRRRNRRRLVQYGSMQVLHKYWLQRYSLFSLFDHGIILDEEGWYSATPEIIAWHHATSIVRVHGAGCLVVDAFGGVGGNAIQLALAGCRVIAIELCPERADIIRNNARVYGVEHEIDIMCGDFMTLGPCLDNVDVVLLSPPWGGPTYSSQPRFDVQEMGGAPEVSFRRLLDTCFGRMGCTSAVFWLPRNSHREQIGIEVASCDSIPDMYRNTCHIELATINNVDKAVTVYVGKCSQNNT
ncbi:Trimethylguanosine synthase [Picochlorum sp. SENEW3]|nr:Trimethylguanosine synthase [Picochlorum sp. SENEW3]